MAKAPWSVGIVALFVCSLVLVHTGCDEADADQATAGAAVAGGSLSISVGDRTDLTVSSDGVSVSAAEGAASPWTVIDARGTGQPWAITLSASDFISAPGSAETTPRTVAVSNLSIGSGPIVAGQGSDPAPAPMSIVLSHSSQTFVTSNREAKGNFTFTPVLLFVRPSDFHAPNHTDGESGRTNPYVSTLAVTIG